MKIRRDDLKKAIRDHELSLLSVNSFSMSESINTPGEIIIMPQKPRMNLAWAAVFMLVVLGSALFFSIRPPIELKNGSNTSQLALTNEMSTAAGIEMETAEEDSMDESNQYNAPKIMSDTRGASLMLEELGLFALPQTEGGDNISYSFADETGERTLTVVIYQNDKPDNALDMEISGITFSLTELRTLDNRLEIGIYFKDKQYNFTALNLTFTELYEALTRITTGG